MVTIIAIFASIIVLIGAMQCAVPAFTRPDLFFAITVHPEFRHTDSARAILRRYRVAVVIHTIVALLLTGTLLLAPALVALPVAGVLWQLGGTTFAYLHARRCTFPFAAAPSMEREAPLDTRKARTGGGWAIRSGPFLLLVGVAAWLRVHWKEIPARFAVHWDLAGHPNGWSQRTPGGVYGPLIIAAGCCLLLILFGSAIAGVRKVHATGPAAAAEMRFRKIMSGALIALAYAMAILFAFVALIPLEHHPQPHVVLVMLGLLLLAGLSVFLMLRAGQGGTRLARLAAVPGAPPAGDRTLDRYWKGGLFYVNPNDAAWLVEKRFGVGYTLNLGNPRAWIALGVLVLFLLLVSCLV